LRTGSSVLPAFGRPPMPPKPAVRPNAGRTEDPVLSQGWVIPAVLIAIIILLLLLFLVALSG
ncbi:serine/threonine protein kinase, partial [Marinitenerispora sediminis]